MGRAAHHPFIVSKACYDGPVSIRCPSIYLDLAYFRKQLEAGFAFEKLEEMVLGIELSRHYTPSPGNEANYETFRRHLEELSPDYPEFKLLVEKTSELLLRKHLPEASPETLANYCLEQQEKEELPMRAVYENTAFQLVRDIGLPTALEKRIYQRALETETCARWFGVARKVNQLFSDAEIEKALLTVSDLEIRKALLKSLVDRGLAPRAIQLYNHSCLSERRSLFRSLAAVRASEDRRVSGEEERFWLAMLESEPLEVFSRGWNRVDRESLKFSFLWGPIKSYFLAHVSERSGEFLVGEKPVLPVDLLMIILALDEGFDLEIWLPAAQYGGYQMVDIDYENGYKLGNRKGKNFPVSEFAVSCLEHRGIELPDSVPVSIPVPYRDPRDR